MILNSIINVKSEQLQAQIKGDHGIQRISNNSNNNEPLANSTFLLLLNQKYLDKKIAVSIVYQKKYVQ
jgi:hypothetical protein